MGGCQSSQSATAAPLRRKGELLEAESKPYLVSTPKSGKKEQYWIDVQELDKETENGTENKTKDPKKKKASPKKDSGPVGVKAPAVDNLASSSKKEDIDKQRPNFEEKQDANLLSISTNLGSSSTPSMDTKTPIINGSTMKPATKKGRAYAVIYDEVKKEPKLMHWAAYEKNHLPIVLAEREKYLKMKKRMERRPKKKVEPTPVPVVTDPVLVVETPKAADIAIQPTLPKKRSRSYAVVYDETKKETKLVHWTTYEKTHLPGVLAERQRHQEMMKRMEILSLERKAKGSDDKANLAVKNVEEPKQINRSQSYAIIYDEVEGQTKLVDWRAYEKDYLPGILAEREKYVEMMKKMEIITKQRHLTDTIPSSTKTVTTPEVQQVVKSIQEVVIPKGPLTLVYDAERQHVKLITWDEYVVNYQQRDIAHWEKQGVSKATPAETIHEKAIDMPIVTPCLPSAVVYDEVTQSAKLISWQEYEKDRLPTDLAIRKEKELMRFKMHKKMTEKARKSCLIERKESPLDLTTMYDPCTKSINLVTWEEYLKFHKPPRQDWMCEYDEGTQSVRLTFWKQYEPKVTVNERFEQVVDEIEAPQANNVPTDMTTAYDPNSNGIVLMSLEDSPKDSPMCDLTTAYDPETESVKLVNLDDYWKTNKAPKQDWMAEYDEKTQSVQLVFWKPLAKVCCKEASHVSEKAANDNLTTIYDPETEGVKLVTLEDYWKTNKAPKQDWMAEYDERTQSVQLVFWKPFAKVGSKEASHVSEKAPYDNLTTIYDPETEGVKLVRLEDYWKTNKAPKQDWMLEYVERTQSVQLVFWKPYAKVCSKEASQVSEKAPNDNLTTIYDRETKGVKLVTLEDYWKTNKAPKQDWMAEYDETTQSVQLVFWKPFSNVQSKVTSTLLKQSQVCDMTPVYDPETKGVKLVSLDDYWKTNKAPKQDWMAEYDDRTQSVQLVFWKPFSKAQSEVTSTSLQQSHVCDLTSVYDPETEGVKLVSLDDYWKKNKAPKQDWMAEYDERTQSVQLVFWKPFSEAQSEVTSTSLQQSHVCDLTSVYDPETEGVKLVSLDDYWKTNKAPKQDWMAEYDEKTQSVQLVFWKPFSEAQSEVTSTLLKQSHVCDLTSVYDPETEGVKLVNLDDYWKTYKAPKQNWMVEYDEKTQSVQLVFWKPFPLCPSNMSCKLDKQVCDMTTIYDPESEEVKLVSLDAFWRTNSKPTQDWMAEYDEINKTVKLVFWKPFSEC